MRPKPRQRTPWTSCKDTWEEGIPKSLKIVISDQQAAKQVISAPVAESSSRRVRARTRRKGLARLLD